MASREQYTSGSGKVESYKKDKTEGHDEIVLRLKDGRRVVISNNTKLGIRVEPKEGDEVNYRGYGVKGTNVVHKVHPNKNSRGGWLEYVKIAEDKTMRKFSYYGLMKLALDKSAKVKTQLIRQLMSRPGHVPSYAYGTKRLHTLQKLVQRAQGGHMSYKNRAKLTGYIDDLSRKSKQSVHGIYDVLDPSGTESLRLRAGMQQQAHNTEIHRNGFPRRVAEGRSYMFGETSPSLRELQPRHIDAADYANVVGGSVYPWNYDLPYWGRKELKDIYDTASAMWANSGAQYNAEQNLKTKVLGRAISSLPGTKLSFNPATIDINGLSPSEAIRLDLARRLHPGTRLASSRGRSALTNTPIFVDDSGMPPDIFDAILRPKILAKGRNAVGTSTQKKMNSFAGPAYTQLTGRLNGSKLTYFPNVAMHELGHGLQDFRADRHGLQRRIGKLIPSSSFGQEPPPQLPGYLRRTRSNRAFERHYMGRKLPAWDSNEDPIKLFRQFSPTTYGEVAADVNAFGTNSSLWPSDIKNALMSYVRKDLSSPEILQRLPGRTLKEKLIALRQYVNGINSIWL